MFEIIPEVQIRQKNYETEEGKLGEKKKQKTSHRQDVDKTNLPKICIK